MDHVIVTLLPKGSVFPGKLGQPLLKTLQTAGIPIDAPCGGKGTCGKCLVLVDGTPVQACQYHLEKHITVRLPEAHEARILREGMATAALADGTHDYVLAFDVGTTTVVAFLLDGKRGTLLSQAACLNPQNVYGADVISRIEYELGHEDGKLRETIRRCLSELALECARSAGIGPEQISLAAIVGNTAMHHLLLGVPTHPLVKPPYMPSLREAVVGVADFLPIAPGAVLRVLPNIAGFVGADTVACMEAVSFDQFEKLTLLIDIGTNGEMVLGNGDKRIACSTAAGPAFEGAKIQFGMRAAEGAIERVDLRHGQLRCQVLGGGKAVGICGSGLLDALRAMLEGGYVDVSGRLCPKTGAPDRWTVFNGQPALALQAGVLLTQKDVREVQLAKAAIRAGIELMCQTLGRETGEIDAVLLAGAFGNYLSPASACAIGMLPPVLLPRIRPIGNAAGEGAKRCALSEAAFEHAKALAAKTDFLELAGLTAFQDCYIDQLSLCEED